MKRLTDDQLSDELPEPICAEIKARHKLTGFHIFDQDGGWRIFANRRDPKGYQASVEQGFGKSITAALNDLDENLRLGPIAAAKKRGAP